MRPMHMPLLAALLSAVATDSHALEASDIFKLADPSIVVITTRDKAGKDSKLGSGVLVAPRELVTSCHVVKDAAGISVRQGNVIRAGKVRYQDEARDLCQLQLDDMFPGARPVTEYVVSSKLEVGQSVYAIGSPRGLERTISRGIVSGLRDVDENTRLIQTDAAISPGSSGGGLFDSEGRLIGIITFGLVQENLNFAIPADWIQQLPGRNRDRAADASPAVVTPTSTAADRPAASWMPQVGDRWAYGLGNGRRRIGTVTVEVTEVRDSKLRERFTYDRSKGFVFERGVEAGFSPARFQSLVVLPGGYQLAEVSPYPEPGTAFSAGANWTDIQGEFAPQGGSRKSAMSSMRVIGQEKVKVPAGEFNAWKIETKSERILYNQIFYVVRCTYWYAPDMKRPVKIDVFTDTELAVARSNEVYELESYTSAGK